MYPSELDVCHSLDLDLEEEEGAENESNPRMMPSDDNPIISDVDGETRTLDIFTCGEAMQVNGWVRVRDGLDPSCLWAKGPVE